MTTAYDYWSDVFCWSVYIGMRNIAANWNTDHLIGERESHRTGCDTCWHVMSLWKCTLETCTGSSLLCMRKQSGMELFFFCWRLEWIKQEMLHQTQFVAVLKFDTGPSPVSHLQITYNWNLKVFHTAIKYSSLNIPYALFILFCFINQVQMDLGSKICNLWQFAYIYHRQ